MKKDLGQLIKQSGIFALGAALSKSVGFIMIPVYTRYLTPRDYGILELLDLVLFVSTTFAAMGIYAAIFRFYAAYETEKDKKEVVATALFYSAGMSLVLSVILVWGAPFFAGIVLGQPSLASFVQIVAFTFLFSNLAESPMAYFRARGRSTLYICLGLTRTLLGALSLSYFLIVLEMGIQGALYANLLTNTIWGLSLSGVVVADVGWRINKEKLSKMLRYGVPTVAWSIAGFILTFSDRLFLRYFASLSEVGIYALGYRLAGVVSVMITGPFNMAWQWQQFELAKRENAKFVFARIEVYLLMVATLVVLGVSVLAKDVLRIMVPESFWGAARVVPLIAASSLLFIIQLVVISGIYIQRTTSRLVVVAVITSAANLALNFLLIPQYQSMGAAVATWLSYALQLTLSFVAAQKCYPVQYDYKRNAVVVAAATSLYFVSTVPALALGLSVAYKLALMMLYLFICYLILDEREKQMVQQWRLLASTGLRRAWSQAR